MINDITDIVDNEALCTKYNGLSNGRQQANEDIEEYYLLNQKRQKEENLINKFIEINKMKNENEFLEDIIINNNDDYNKIIVNCKNKYACLKSLMKHLNNVSADINNNNRMMQELKIEKMMLMEEMLNIKNTLDNLRM